mgnify:CR=1 FL=1
MPGFRIVSDGVSELESEVGLQITHVKYSVVMDWVRYIVVDKTNNDAVIDLDRRQLFDIIASRVENFPVFLSRTANKYYS